MSKVLSSDPNDEHSMPLSVNMERFGPNAPLMRSVSLLDNASHNDQPAAHQSSPTVSRGLILYSMSYFLRNVS